MANFLFQPSVAKYVREVRALPKEYWNWRFFVTVVAFALGGPGKGWDEGSASSITQPSSFKRVYDLGGGGALLSFFLNDRIGRINSMRVYMAAYASGSLISCFSYSHFRALYVGRIVSGLSWGALTVIGPMTLAEIAPRRVRGLMTLWFNVVMLTTQGIGIYTVLGSSVPDPLLTSDHEAADHTPGGYWSKIKEMFTVHAHLRRLELVVIVYILAQFSGASSITNYLPTIFALVGIADIHVKVAASGAYAFTKAIFCLLASLVCVDLLGLRKSLMLSVSIQIPAILTSRDI
ncbi:hypothetical protein GGR57DRAFT_519140 [Xylariaceae sp. FL1272]|nr:hypothetical protein GGR57DRAFT_519140 [Xylariaceae sp. FL1272]